VPDLQRRPASVGNAVGLAPDSDARHRRDPWSGSNYVEQAIEWLLRQTITDFELPAARRDGLRAHLAERNIDSTVHYPNLLEQPAFKGCRGEVPVAARETRRVISLPLHQSLEPSEIDRICEAVHDFLG
jgi:dTDP-4-amino-4,6-dideoxygalactose transaminase